LSAQSPARVPAITLVPAQALAAAPGRDLLGPLTVFLGVLVLVPSRLVFKPLGAAGTPAAMVAMGMLALWVAAWVVPGTGMGPAKGQPVRWAFTVFVAAVLAGYVAVGLGHLPADDLSNADRALIAVAAWGGILLGAADGVRDRDRLELLIGRVVLAGAVLAAIGILQFFTGFDVSSVLHIPGLSVNEPLALINERASFRRVAGTAVHPIEFGVVLAMVFPLALYRAFNTAKGAGLGQWLSVLLLAVAIPMSLSRSAFLGLFAVALVLAPTWRGTRLVAAGLIAPVFTVAMQAVAPGLLGTIKSLFVGLTSDPSFQGRTEDYSVVGQFISQSPLFGRGLGTFDPARYVLLDNQYLGTLIELGAFGLVALLGMFVTGIVAARAARRRGGDERWRELGQCLAASVAVCLVSFVTFDAFAFPMASAMTFLMLGCAGAAWRVARQPGDPHQLRSPGPPGQPAAVGEAAHA
jgi:O-antigen ligase